MVRIHFDISITSTVLSEWLINEIPKLHIAGYADSDSHLPSPELNI